MNKIYKVIWSKTKHCYVVVSELATRNTKSASTCKSVSDSTSASFSSLLCVAAIVGATFFAPFSINAADNGPGTGTGVTIGTGSNTSTNTSVAIGSNSSATGNSSIAIGRNAKANSDDSENQELYGAIAIGTNAEAKGKQSLALGAYAKALGIQSSAFGNNATAKGKKSVAIGDNAVASVENDLVFGSNASTDPSSKGNNIVLGTTAAITRGADSIAMGSGAKVASTGGNNIVFGSIAAITDGADSIAMGSGAKIDSSGGSMIALGKGAAITSSAHLNAMAIGTKSKVEGDGLAIGPEASVTSSSTLDGSGIAIGKKAKVDAQEGGIAIGKGATATNTSGAKGAPIAIGQDSNVTGIQSMALGYKATTSGNQEKVTTIGALAAATGTSQFATLVGAETGATREKTTALGYKANATADGGVALGAESVADRFSYSNEASNMYVPGTATAAQRNAIEGTKATTGAVSVGSSTVRRQIINVAAGSADTDAVNVAQLKAATGAAAQAANWTIQDGGTNPGKKVIDTSTPLTVKGDTLVKAKVSDEGLQLSVDTAKLNDTINNQINSNTTIQQHTNNISKLQGGFTVSNEAGTKQTINLGGETPKNIKFKGEANKIGVAVANASDGAVVTVTADPKLGQNIDITNNSAITALKAGFDLKANSKTSTVALGGAKPTIEFAAADNTMTVDLDGNKVSYGINKENLVSSLNTSTTAITNISAKFGVTAESGNKKTVTLTKDQEPTVKFVGDGNILKSEMNADGVKYSVDSAKLNEAISSNTTVTTNKSDITNLKAGFNVKAGNVTGAVKAGETLEFAGNNYVETSYDQNGKKMTIGLTEEAKNKIDSISTSITNSAKWTIQDGEANPGKKEINAATPLTVKGDDLVKTKVDNNGLSVTLDKTALAGQITNNETVVQHGSDITNLKAGFTVTANGDATKKSVIKAGEVLDFAAGDNAVVTTEANSKKITIAMSKTPNLEKVTIKNTSNVAGATDVVIDGNGVNAGNKQITNVASGGTVDTNAANIKDVKDAVAKAGDEAVQYDKNSDGSVNKEKVTLGGGSNGTLITNVKNGNVASGSKDAINGGQLFDAKQELTNSITNTSTTLTNTGLKFGDDSNKEVTNKLGSKVNVKGGGTKADTAYASGNLKTKITQTEAGETTIDVMLDKDLSGLNSITAGSGEKAVAMDGTKGTITVGTGTNAVALDGTKGEVKAGVVTVNGKDGHITGLTNKEWDVNSPTAVSGRAATEDQLKKVNDAIQNFANTSSDYSLVVNPEEGSNGAYSVKNNEVTLTVKDKNHPTAEAKTIVIKDVASAADLAKLNGGAVQYDKKQDGTYNKDKVTFAGGTNGTQLSNVASGLGTTVLKDAQGDTLKNAANIGDLKTAIEGVSSSTIDTLTEKGLKFGGNEGGEVTNKLGSKVTVKGTGEKADSNYSSANIKTKVTQDKTTGETTIEVMMDKELSADKLTVGQKGENGQNGKDGEIGVNGKDGEAVVINGKDGVSVKGKDGKDAVSMSGKDGVGHIGLKGADGTNGKDGTNAIDISVKNGYDDAAKGINGKNGVDGTNGITRIVYTDATGEHQVATMEDGMKYGADNTTADASKVIKKKLNDQVNVIGGITDETALSTIDNIGVISNGMDSLKVRLAKNLKGLSSVTTTTEDGKTNVMDGTGNTITDGTKETKVTAGGTSVTDGTSRTTYGPNGMTIEKDTDPNTPGIQPGDGSTTVGLTADGLNNGGNRITNVADGKKETDAATVGQMNAAIEKAAAKATTKVVDGKNTTVRATPNQDGSTSYAVDLNDTVTLGKDASKQVKMDGEQGTISAGTGDKAVAMDGTKGTITAGTGENAVTMDGTKGQVKAGKVIIDGKEGVVKGLTNTTWDPKNPTIVSGRAATEDQLKAVNDAMNQTSEAVNAGWEAQVNGTKLKDVTPTNRVVNYVDGDNLTVTGSGNNVTFATKKEVTFEKVTTGDTVMDKNGITIGEGDKAVKLSKDGLDNGGNKISNVGKGEKPNDAATMGQLQEVMDHQNDWKPVVNKLSGEVMELGASSAALAGLKPIAYNPVEPTQIMAAIGNYRSSTAVAIGLAHYTREDLMLHAGATFGTEHNLVNAGVTWRLGSTSKKAMVPDQYKPGPITAVYGVVDEVQALKAENEALKKSNEETKATLAEVLKRLAQLEGK